MELEALDVKEWLLLCGRAEQRWIDRLTELARRVRDKDSTFAKVLEELADEERKHIGHLEALDEQTPMPSVWHIDEAAIERIMGKYFPALTSPANPRADRKNIEALAGAVESECIRFYTHLAERATNDATKAFFQRMTEMEETHKERLS